MVITGVWKLEVSAEQGTEDFGTLTDFTLVLHGTKESTYLIQNNDQRHNVKLEVVRSLHEKFY